MRTRSTSGPEATYARPNASEYAAVSFESTSIPAPRSACPTRVVPAKRSAAERAPSSVAGGRDRAGERALGAQVLDHGRDTTAGDGWGSV